MSPPVLTFLAVGAVCRPANGQSDSVRAIADRLFTYDRAAPLDVRDSVLFTEGGVAVYDVTYASSRGGCVTAYLVVPPGPGPFAGIVFGHWSYGTRTEVLRRTTNDPASVLTWRSTAWRSLTARSWSELHWGKRCAPLSASPG